MGERLSAILKQYWGYDTFRPLQGDIIRSVMQGHDTLGLMPTGGGKSLTFQVPTLAMEGLCVVITPLIALMKDQVARLNSMGIKAVAVYSGMSSREIERLLDNCVYGDYRFLYLSPERLSTDMFLWRWPHMNVCLIAIDEAHCISQWGYDFRPSYLSIAKIRAQKPHVPVLALTATATPRVVEDIQDKLQFRERCVFQKSFTRPNLVYMVRYVEDKLGTLVDLLQRVPGSSVVYVRNRKKTREVAEYLVQQGVSATFFHAGLSNFEKDERQRSWMGGKVRVMVSTNAFGMGIDKPDVRSVIHLDLPDTPEAYFQEAGRAGRDGDLAYAYLLYNKSDEVKMRRRIADNYPPKDFVRQVYDNVCNYYQVPIGEGCDRVYPFELMDFCAHYKLSSLTTYNALQLLQLAQVLEVTEEQDSKARVVFMSTREELYDIVFTSLEESIVQVLLRSYTGLFSDLVYVDEDMVASRVGCTHRQLCQALIELSRRHIIRYVPRRTTPYICFTSERLRTDLVNLGKEVYDDRKQRYIEHIDAMLSYATQHEECRSRYLLSYFGEQNADICHQCDVCGGDVAHDVSDENVQHHIQLVLRDRALSLSELLAQLPFEHSVTLRVLRMLLDEGWVVQQDGCYIYRG